MDRDGFPFLFPGVIPTNALLYPSQLSLDAGDTQGWEIRAARESVDVATGWVVGLTDLAKDRQGRKSKSTDQQGCHTTMAPHYLPQPQFPTIHYSTRHRRPHTKRGHLQEARWEFPHFHQASKAAKQPPLVKGERDSGAFFYPLQQRPSSSFPFFTTKLQQLTRQTDTLPTFLSFTTCRDFSRMVRDTPFPRMTSIEYLVLTSCLFSV